MKYLNDDKEVAKQEEEYMKYTTTHINNVHTAFERLFEPVQQLPGYTEDETERILDLLKYAVANHDESKFSDDEFYAYRRNFNPTAAENNEKDQLIQNQAKDEYDKAWRHHYTHNDHHPRFWCSINIISTYEFGMPKEWDALEADHDPIDMSIVSICHMICDWEAMSIYFKSDMIKWYTSGADDERHCMTEKTRNITRDIMAFVYKKEVPTEEEIQKMYDEKSKKEA
jgi:hypothetical protein